MISEAATARPVAIQFAKKIGATPIPLKPFRRGDKESKRPLHNNWPNRTYTEEELVGFIQSGHSLGYRLPPEILVVDVDFPSTSRPNKRGDKSFEKLMEYLGTDDFETALVRSESGGFHYYFRKPTGLKVSKSLREFPDIDFLSEGSCVLSPGSPHWLGGWYELEDVSGDIPEAPTKLLELIEKRSTTTEGREGGSIDADILETILKPLNPIDFRDQRAWQDLMASAHHGTGGCDRACQVFVDWSISDPEYADQADIIRRRWHSFNSSKNNPITLATLLGELRKVDSDEAKKAFASLQQFEVVRQFSDLPTDQDDKVPGIDHPAGRTDAANSRRFAIEYQGQVLYVAKWRKWLTWDGSRWIDDGNIAVTELAKEYANSLWLELASIAPIVDRNELGVIQTFVKRSNQVGGISAMIDLAKSDRRITCQPDSLNEDPLVLNLENGTLDLRNQELRPHQPSDRITQRASVKFVSDAQCPLWLDTLELIFRGDQKLIRYVQMVLGYCISGDIGEHILPIAFGSGSNGKSTIWNTIEAILGDYAHVADESLLLGDSADHPTGKACMYQKRFVAISEPEQHSRLKEARVKELTGDATVTARRMKEDFWSFKRTHKFWLSTNHLPRIKGNDEGIWRRVKLIPFTVDVRKKAKRVIPNLNERLVKQEASGILNWLLEGWKQYQLFGFSEPKAVTIATTNYRNDSDILGEWVADNCIVEDGGIATAKELYQRYQETGGKWSATAFGRNMAERFEKEKPAGGAYRRQTIYHGLRLTDRSADEFSQGPEADYFSDEN